MSSDLKDVAKELAEAYVFQPSVFYKEPPPETNRTQNQRDNVSRMKALFEPILTKHFSRAPASMEAVVERIAELTWNESEIEAIKATVRAQLAEVAADLTELRERRDAEEAADKLLAEDGCEIEIKRQCATLTRDDGATNVRSASGDNWHAALTALVAAGQTTEVGE